MRLALITLTTIIILTLVSSTCSTKNPSNPISEIFAGSKSKNKEKAKAQAKAKEKEKIEEDTEDESTDKDKDNEDSDDRCVPQLKDCKCGIRRFETPEEALFRKTSGKLYVTPAKHHEFMHRVSIMIKYKDSIFNMGFFNTFCGGSVISENYILTAAHCCSNILPILTFDILLSILNKAGGIPVFSLLFPDGVPDIIPNLLTPTEAVDPAWVSVSVAEHDLSKPDGEKIYEVAEVISHKDFKWRVMESDICLLKLKKPLKLDYKKVAPICLPWNLTEKDMRKKDRVVISGWGKRDEKDSKLPDILQKMDGLPLMNSEDCAKFYKEKFNSDIITAKMICTYVKGMYKGPCQRDSGGSIDLYDLNRTMYHAVGVVSFGKHCDKDRPAAPAVYTKLTEYKDWINEMTNCEPFCYPQS